jgi:hypothetical protein
MTIGRIDAPLAGRGRRRLIEPLGDADGQPEHRRHPLLLALKRRSMASSQLVTATSSAVMRLSNAEKWLPIAVNRCCRSRISTVSVRTRAEELRVDFFLAHPPPPSSTARSPLVGHSDAIVDRLCLANTTYGRPAAAPRGDRRGDLSDRGSRVWLVAGISRPVMPDRTARGFDQSIGQPLSIRAAAFSGYQ